MKKLLVIAITAGLVGCGSNHLGLIGNHTIEYKGERLIVIKYNSGFENYEAMLEDAMQHCAQFGKEAKLVVPAVESSSLKKAHTFYCVEKTGPESDL